jgi:DNA invertase Pin-like site-specific DNA recombinase
MRIGYARVSTGKQRLDIQPDAVDAADCEKTCTDTISGQASSRPELDFMFIYLPLLLLSHRLTLQTAT